MTDTILILVLVISCIFSAVLLTLLFSQRRQAKKDFINAEREEERRRRTNLEFSSLAADILSRETASLKSSNREEIETLLSPLRLRLAEFQKAINDSSLKESSSRAALSKQIELLAQSNLEIGNEARRLSQALRGDTHSQGEWGENVLRRILESAGMIADIHYLTQSSSIGGKALTSDDGRSYRPDFILLLPGGHKVVVDSKTSLTDYLKYAEASDELRAKEYLRRHVASVKKHVKELADKQYHRLVEGAMEHSLMFMPNEGAFLAAIRGDAELCEYAFRNNVVIVSPAHLLSVVQLISQMWRIERQNRNAEAIAEAGGQLYDRFVGFLADFEKIERSLQASMRAYENCLHHISGSNRSLTAKAERLRKMGAKVTRRIPESMLTDEEAPYGSEEE